MKQLKRNQSTKETIIAETSDTCFYFYQLVSGENLFLDPLCLQILNKDRQLKVEAAAAEETKTM